MTKNSFWFLNVIIQINNNVKSGNKIGENGAKYIGENMKELKNL